MVRSRRGRDHLPAGVNAALRVPKEAAGPYRCVGGGSYLYPAAGIDHAPDP